MLPRALLSSGLGAGDQLALHYLGPRDEPWLRALLDEHARYVGRKRVELRERLREPLAVRAPKQQLRLAMEVLERIAPDAARPALAPAELRFRLFHAAAARDRRREAVVEQVASELGVAASEIEAALFVDLAGERRLGPLPAELSPPQLALLANQALAMGLLRRASLVRIRAWGQSRALVRHARLLGLICRVLRTNEPEGATLEISGPFALFRRTEVYGRALSSLLPRAARCNHFELEAHCVLARGSQPARFVIRSGDPVFPARELPPHDSRVEARFARDFGRAARDWHVVREPKPIEAGESLMFPDFELVHRHDSKRRWLLEIVGFWTPRYLDEKLKAFASAGLGNVILCIDARRRCSEAELPAHAQVIYYKGRIDPRSVLAKLEAER